MNSAIHVARHFEASSFDLLSAHVSLTSLMAKLSSLRLNCLSRQNKLLITGVARKILVGHTSQVFRHKDIPDLSRYDVIRVCAIAIRSCFAIEHLYVLVQSRILTFGLVD
jgi:hypothetical protein